MGVLPDWMLRDAPGLITPLEDCMKRAGVISYGMTSYGYDLRCGYTFDIFTNVYGGTIDPKNFNTRMLARIDHSQYAGRVGADNPAYVDIPPNSFALAETVEVIRVPRSCLALVIGKSTYARCGLVVNVTPLEPEWRGRVTMELSNTAQLPSRVYAGEGIAQVLFLSSAGNVNALFNAVSSICDALGFQRTRQSLFDEHSTCDVSYADKNGKYQDQVGLTNPKVD